METGKEKVIRVVVSEGEKKALLSVLNLFAETDDSDDPKVGRMAAKLRDSIMKYGKNCRTKRAKNANGYLIFLLESEAAVMIQLFAMFANASMPQQEENTVD